MGLLKRSLRCAGTQVSLDIFEAFGLDCGDGLHRQRPNRMINYHSYVLRLHMNKRRNVVLGILVRAGPDYPLQPLFPQKYELLHFPSEHIHDCKDFARLYDPKRIDISLLKEWLHTCRTDHGVQCSGVSLPPLKHSILLVDVKHLCLVRINAGIPVPTYAALSYVWGHAVSLQTTRLNLNAYLSPGGLRSQEAGRISNTITDAIQLTRSIGLDYLWVDSLCIIQDDTAFKNLHLRSMASIYANANVTIVAAEGFDADNGIRGLPGSVRVREIERNIVETGSGTGALLCPVKPLWPEASNWNSRGWTFQELLFSKRILILDGGPVSWHCARQHLEEDKVRNVDASHPTNDIFIVRATFTTSPKDPISAWADLVQRFNRRQLTYDEDVVAAFASITSLMTSTLGGVHHGLATKHFPDGLLWQPAGPTRRRRRTRGNKEQVVLPSWSWIGWQGEIDCSMWHGHRRPSDTGNVTFYPYPYRYVPKIDLNFEPVSSFSYHDTVPADVPLKNSTGHLSVASTMTKLQINGTFCNRNSLLSFRLRQGCGTDVGYILPQGYEGGKLTECSGPCEILAIHSGRLRNKTIDKYLSTDGKDPQGVTEVYIVLWVVRIGDHMERRGIGAVLRKFWESEEAGLVQCSVELG